MNERELIKRAQAGDYEAFSELVNDSKAKLFGFVMKLVGNSDDADDIVQETYLKAIDKIEQFRSEASFSTWLTTIALNLARAMYARNKQAPLKSIEEYLPVDPNESHQSFSLFDWRDPHAALEDKELAELVKEGLKMLPDKYREAFLLRYVSEMSVKEIAVEIGESVAAVKSRILR
ncbi:MAG: sigma-70 family RNA polymerase sigma factor, partial [candidate division Zixibacteria bacterium]